MSPFPDTHRALPSRVGGRAFPATATKERAGDQQFFPFPCVDPEREDQALELPSSRTPRMGKKGHPAAGAHPVYPDGNIQGTLPEA